VHEQQWDGAAGLEVKAGHIIAKPEVLFTKFKPEDGVAAGQDTTVELNVIVDKDVAKLGVKVRAAVIEGIAVKKRSNALEKMKKEAAERFFLNDAIMDGYRSIYRKIGMPEIRNPIENLAAIMKNSGKMPTINTVVDSYNIVAAKRNLSVGAHDLAKIEGSVIRFKVTDGTEEYVPLGSDQPAKIGKGEFAAVDAKHVLCRLDIKQGEHTKVTEGTRGIFIYVQGNDATDGAYLEAALKEICDNVTRFCGGKSRIL